MCGLSGVVFEKFNFDQQIEIDGLLTSKDGHFISKEIRGNKFFLYAVSHPEIYDKLDFIISDDETKEDILFYIKKIIPLQIEFIEKYSGSEIQKLDTWDILFSRFLYFVLNSVDKNLEVRGRDSFGISIKVKSKFIPAISNDDCANFSCFKDGDGYISLVVIKVANESGRLGQNVEFVKEQLNKGGILRAIFESQWSESSILAHTRWATVGGVNLTNCQPISSVEMFRNAISYAINGDITNYSELDQNKKLKSSDSDSQVLRFLFDELTEPANEDYFQCVSKIKGSVAVAMMPLFGKNRILLSLRGLQGLFIGRLDGATVFASDLYGIVELTPEYLRVQNLANYVLNANGAMLINAMDDYSSVIDSSSWSFAQVHPRDIAIHGYEHFLIKEIYETQTIIKRSLKNFDSFDFGDPVYVKIKKNIESGLIRRIILTGMGSCYTSSVAIVKFLTLIANTRGIEISAEIASEASAFQVYEQMSDTLVIVVAQSGTTIDTNVFAKIARLKNATTIAIANKRGGDVTFLVEKTFYIGNGRDVELSVPSTKSYSAQILTGILLGTILLDSSYKMRVQELIYKFNRINFKNLIEKNLKRIDHNLLNKIYKSRYWIIAHDESEYASFALELRIKLSECCYKTVSIISEREIGRINQESFFIFYVGKNKSLINKLNHVDLVEMVEGEDAITKFFDLILLGQVLAYKLALGIDKLSNAIRSGVNIKQELLTFVGKKDNCMENDRESIILSNFLERPIDTVKHQAKTITVGAIRGGDESHSLSFHLEQLPSNKSNMLMANDYFETIKSLKLDLSIDTLNKSRENFFFKDFLRNYHLAIDITSFKNNFQIKNLENNEKMRFFFNKLEVAGINEFFLNEVRPLLELWTFKLDYIDNDYVLDKFKQDLNEFILKLKLSKKASFEQNDLDLIKKIDAFNWKILGSGSNYYSAKMCSMYLMALGKIPTQTDVLENHKHIDMSAESNLLVFANNIKSPGYQDDVVSEVSKMVAHKNKVFLVSDDNESCYEKLRSSDCSVISMNPIDHFFGAYTNLHFFQNLL